MPLSSAFLKHSNMYNKQWRVLYPFLNPHKYLENIVLK